MQRGTATRGKNKTGCRLREATSSGNCLTEDPLKQNTGKMECGEMLEGKNEYFGEGSAG